jgi:hypothetical protein
VLEERDALALVFERLELACGDAVTMPRAEPVHVREGGSPKAGIRILGPHARSMPGSEGSRKQVRSTSTRDIVGPHFVIVSGELDLLAKWREADLHARGAEVRLRRALRDQTAAEIRAVKARRDRLAFAYCSANVRARRDHASPRCFDRLPPLDMPAVFDDARTEVA